MHRRVRLASRVREPGRGVAPIGDFCAALRTSSQMIFEGSRVCRVERVERLWRQHFFVVFVDHHILKISWIFIAGLGTDLLRARAA